MTENTNEQGNNEQTGEEVKVKKPRVVKHIDVRIEEMQADIADLNTKLAALIAERDSREFINTLTAGDLVSFEFGRAESKRVLSGRILAASTNEETGVRQFNVLTGEGLDSRTLLITGAAIIVDGASAE